MVVLSFDLPAGFRFSPKDKELIEFYLKPKITGNDKDIWFIPEIEFYEDEPWDLPIKTGIASEDQEWFFFTVLSPKHQNDNPKKRKRGQKQELVNRQTKAGFWKSTGKDREIESGGVVVGTKKSLVFHRGSTKGKGKGIGTNWVMHEYSTTQKEFDGRQPGQVGFGYSVCMNVPAPNFSESVDLTLINPDEFSRKMSSSQTNLAFDDGTLKNMVSDKDNGSCSGSDANALLFVLVDPELVSLDEILNPEVSSGVHHQSGMNVPAPNFSESRDLTLINPDEFFRKMSSSQTNLAFDDGTLKNMVSDKDNGSCSGSDANALLFVLEDPELVSLDEILNPE
ncbi:nac domain-containing protein 14, partial [Quercus suber]